jgi:hypothetical protein
MKAARRWLPWIGAYTGARINKLMRLTAADFVMRDGIWMIRIRGANSAIVVPIYSNDPNARLLHEIAACLRLLQGRMATLFGMFPFLKTLFSDSGYQGPQFARALAKVLPHLDIEIVKRSDEVGGFVVLPKRWIVERTIAWLNRCRRLAKDWGKAQPKGARVLASRLNPPHAQKTMQSDPQSPDGL